MFRGSFAHTIDPKGRVSVPAKYREVIAASNDDRVVITNYRSKAVPCLDVYRFADWVRLEERLAQQSGFDPRVEDFVNYYVAAAQDCQVDKQGRILLPPLLRQHAHLNDAVMFTGHTAKFRIWDQNGWHQVVESSEKSIFEDPGSFFTKFQP